MWLEALVTAQVTGDGRLGPGWKQWRSGVDCIVEMRWQSLTKGGLQKAERKGSLKGLLDF